MKKLLLLLFASAIFQLNAQNKYLKKMGGDGDLFYILHKEKIDFSKSFTIQYARYPFFRASSKIEFGLLLNP